MEKAELKLKDGIDLAADVSKELKSKNPAKVLRTRGKAKDKSRKADKVQELHEDLCSALGKIVVLEKEMENVLARDGALVKMFDESEVWKSDADMRFMMDMTKHVLSGGEMVQFMQKWVSDLGANKNSRSAREL